MDWRDRAPAGSRCDRGDPPEAARSLLALLLATLDIPAADFPYDPANGEPYNSRER